MSILKRDFFKLILFIYILNISQSLAKDKCNFNLQILLNLIRVPPEKPSKPPSGFQTTEDLIRSRGFGYEKYRDKTEDGFIVAYHRIVTNTPGGQPVLFLHGLTAASDCWLLTERKNNIAFQLADAGYDVWLGDMRGNYYSREHVKYKPNSKEFWDFSFHESAIYDLPAYIDGIINKTKYPKVIVFGISMGGTLFFALTSARPEYNDKIKLGVLFAPASVTPPLQELKSPALRFVFSNIDLIYKFVSKQGKYEFGAREEKLIKMVRNCCNPSKQQQMCLTIHGLAFGDHRSNYNLTTFGNFFSYLFSGTSSKNEYHMGQISRGDFALFDYGPKENLLRYNSTKPPLYPLEKVTAPVAIYWGENDVFLNQNSINELVSRLPNVVENYKVEDPKFNHVDFVVGLNTPSIVNPRVIELLKKFE